jgi:predicted  nucleic acid-binding Zn-ribbon protein
VTLRPLLAVQALDTALTQLHHRLATLPERAELQASTAALAEVERSIAGCRNRAGEIEQRVADIEAAGATLEAKKSRFEAQLKTVIAPREAEALQHEIAVVVAERSRYDDEELELLDEAERLAVDVAGFEELRAQRAARVESDRARTEAAAADVQQRIDATTAERAATVAGIAAELVAKYEASRSRATAVTVAEVVKNSCTGCHTALSPKEIGQLKATGSGEDPRCPYCSCLLVV